MAKKKSKKVKNCVKGYSCGYSCIATSKSCINTLKGQGKSYAEWLQIKAKAGSFDSLSDFHKVHLWNNETFKDAPDDLKAFIESNPKPHIIESQQGYGPYYNRHKFEGEGGIHMAEYTSDSLTGSAAWRHEYGHHLDAKAGTIESFALVKSRMNDAFQQSLGMSFDDARRELKRRDDEITQMIMDGITGTDTRYNQLAREMREMNEQVAQLIKKVNPDYPLNHLVDVDSLIFNTKGQLYSQSPDFQSAMKSDGDRLKSLPPFTNPQGEPRTHSAQEYNAETGRLSVPYLYDNAVSDEARNILNGLGVRDRPELLPDMAPSKNEAELVAWVLEEYVGRGIAQDLIGSMTLNEVGYGHTDEYYKRAKGNQNTEVFANLVSLYGTGDPAVHRAVEYLAPSTFAELKRLINE